MTLHRGLEGRGGGDIFFGDESDEQGWDEVSFLAGLTGRVLSYFLNMIKSLLKTLRNTLFDGYSRAEIVVRSKSREATQKLGGFPFLPLTQPDPLLSYQDPTNGFHGSSNPPPRSSRPILALRPRPPPRRRFRQPQPRAPVRTGRKEGRGEPRCVSRVLYFGLVFECFHSMDL